MRPSAPPGSFGLGAFVRSLDGRGGAFLLRFVAAFVGLSLALVLLAPAYAALLASAASLGVPVLEPDRRTHYAVEGSKIVAVRALVVHGTPVTVRLGLWDGKYVWNLTLLLAALLAVPDWSRAARRRALAYGALGLVSAHFLNLLTNIVYTQMRPAPGWTPYEFSEVTQHVVSVTSFFFDVAGNGFFAILLFALLVAKLWRPAAADVAVGRNDACPCGSGRKAKRCCQRTRAAA